MSKLVPASSRLLPFPGFRPDLRSPKVFFLRGDLPDLGHNLIMMNTTKRISKAQLDATLIHIRYSEPGSTEFTLIWSDGSAQAWDTRTNGTLPRIGSFRIARPRVTLVHISYTTEGYRLIWSDGSKTTLGRNIRRMPRIGSVK